MPPSGLRLPKAAFPSFHFSHQLKDLPLVPAILEIDSGRLISFDDRDGKKLDIDLKLHEGNK